MTLFKAIATVSGLTLVSRIAGFARDILTASILGAGPIADAFFVALRLPNFFRRIFAEGAFSASFVPLYSEKSETEGRPVAVDF
ncbi:MAG: lipid II flippase MurJ, partial [Pseudomonadota bacterium]